MLLKRALASRLRYASGSTLSAIARPSLVSRSYASLSQSSSRVQEELNFPGSVRSKFTEEMKFRDPETEEAMPTYRLVGLDGKEIDTQYEIPFSKEESVTMYREMVLLSIMDSIMYDAQRQGRLSFYMVAAGEEGMLIGSSKALGKHDQIFSQYREAGVFLHRGLTLREIMAQLTSNKEDAGRGVNMPVHYQNKKLGIHSISSPLATQIPHAAGAAYALKMQNMDAAAICYFGEGAASEGDFHAALNIAATRNCPIVFFCRNNGYAISTPSLEQYRGDGIASRGLGYGIETIRVDGNDLAAVHRVTAEARRRAIDGQRPILIEAMSYRVSHHSTSDDSFAYRSRVEVEDWKRRDSPIARWRKWLELRGWWSEEEEQEARKELRRQVLSEFTAAEKVKKPEIGSLFHNVYDKLTPELKEQMAELAEILDEYPEHYSLSDYEGGRDGLR